MKKQLYISLLFLFAFPAINHLSAQQHAHHPSNPSDATNTMNTVIPDFQVNDDQESSSQWCPSMAVDGSGNFVIVWQDERHGDDDIYAQRYSSDGTALGVNFNVNDDQESADGSLPSIAVDESGNFVIVWQYVGNFSSTIYAQRYSSDGIALGGNFKVNDDQEFAYHVDPSISSDGSGNFVIVWQYSRNDSSDIYAQRYTSDGTSLGGNFKVNDDQESVYHANPSVSTDGSGNFVIAWRYSRNDSTDIYAQRYASDGIALEGNFKVNDNMGTVWTHPRSTGHPISISSDGSGNLVIVWQDSRNDKGDIYAQRYASDGTALGGNFKVNDDQESDFPEYPFISSDISGNFVITWDEERNGDYDIYAQRYTGDGAALGSNFRVTNTSDGRQDLPSVRLWNNRIYTAWLDNRLDSTDSDIWANVLDWESPVGIDDDEPSQMPSVFKLCQNYPNPFNPTTVISYQLSVNSQVKLKIYDLSGREITTIVNERKPAGRYSVEWDAKGLASGIYYYRLEAGNHIETRKMVVMK